MRKHTLTDPFNSLNKKLRQIPSESGSTITEEPPESGSATTVQEVIDSLKALSYSADINEFVHIIEQMLEAKKHHKGRISRCGNWRRRRFEDIRRNRTMWSSLITSGAKFLKFVNDHTEEIEDKEALYSVSSRVVAGILEQIEQLHWAVGGLAIAAYLIEKFDEVSADKAEVLEVLSKMVDLVTTVVKLKNVIPEGGENMKKAVMVVLEGSIMFVSQIYSDNIFSFLRTSVKSINLTKMSNTLDDLRRDLNSEDLENMFNTDVTLDPTLETAEDSVVIQSKRYSEIANLQSTIERCQSTIERCQSEMEMLQSEMEMLQSEIERRQSEMKKLQLELEGQQSMRQSEMADRQSIFSPVPKPMAKRQSMHQSAFPQPILPLMPKFAFPQPILPLMPKSAFPQPIFTPKERQSIFLPVPKPFYSKDAVEIETARKEVTNLLNMTLRTEEESILVVIYGFGGIGKTTLANFVVEKLNLYSYNYAMVSLNEKMSKKELKKAQELILKYAFPSFDSQAIILRDCEEGRDRLTEAFGCVENKPVFLFIDNVLRSEDLTELLPEDLSGLPTHSRILITTRTLRVTDGFLTSGIKRCPFVMKTLDKDYAAKILFKNPDSLVIKDYMERILRICGGVPLALRIVHGHLVQKGLSKSHQVADVLLDALERGGYVKEKKLSHRLLHSVYNDLEDSTKDAFLDICCFFNGCIRRHVEYIVGASEVKSLEEAALVTTFVDKENMEGIYAGEERLIVHSILSARGRSMSASTRFTDVGSFCQVTQDKTRLKGIKGLWFGDSPSDYVFEVQHLNSMRHSLRIMSLGCNMRTSAQSPLKFKELRYLKVGEAVPHTPMKLEELDMLRIFEGPDIFPNGISMIKLSKRLCMIRNINRSHIATSEDSSATQSIQNHYLQELHLFVGNHKQLEGLDQLRSLRVLSLYVYADFMDFPEQICKLSSLIKLRIVGWRRLQHLPESFGRLEGLTYVELRCCFELEELPSSFSQLTALEHLSLAYCPRLKQLPGGLESLKYLDVRGSKYLSLEFYQYRPDLRIVHDA